MSIQHWSCISICSAVFCLLVCTPTSVAATAEIIVFAPGGVRSALLGAAASFQRDTGIKVNFTFGTGGGDSKTGSQRGSPPMSRCSRLRG